MERRRFTREFKVEAVKLVTDRGVAIAQAGTRSMDISGPVLRRVGEGVPHLISSRRFRVMVSRRRTRPRSPG